MRKGGHIVLNPSFLPSELKGYREINYKMIDQANAVYLMKGWKSSIGASLEYEYAKRR